MAAPLFKGSATICGDPLSIVKCNNVCPFSPVVDVSTPRKRSSSAAFSCPISCRSLVLSCSETEAPCTNSSCITPRWPCSAACRRGVESIGSLGGCWMPASNKRVISFIFPSAAALPRPISFSKLTIDVWQVGQRPVWETDFAKQASCVQGGIHTVVTPLLPQSPNLLGKCSMILRLCCHRPSFGVPQCWKVCLS